MCQIEILQMMVPEKELYESMKRNAIRSIVEVKFREKKERKKCYDDDQTRRLTSDIVVHK